MFNDQGSFLEDGEMLDKLMSDIIDEGFRYSLENTSTIDPERSLYDFFEERVSEYVSQGSDGEHQKRMVMQMSELWGGFVGSHVTSQSLKFFWLEECVNGGKYLSRTLHKPLIKPKSILPEKELIHASVENLFCGSLFRGVIDVIAKPAQQANIIKLSTKVTSINSNSDIIKVTTDSGNVLEFDEVVVRCGPTYSYSPHT